MPVKLTRPVAADGVRLYYRSKYDVRSGMVGGHYRGPTFIPPRGNDEKGLFRLLDTDNVRAVIRLYRWFLREYDRVKERGDSDMSGLVEKDDLMGQCFGDTPMSKHRVGRLLRLIVQYETNFQQNPSKANGQRTVMNWRWTHPLDIVYGLEHVMSLWLPRVVVADGGSCSTEEEFLEELEIIRDQDSDEEQELIDVIVSKKLI